MNHKKKEEKKIIEELKKIYSDFPKGNMIYGWLGLAAGSDYDQIHVWDGRNLSTSSRGWLGNTAEFDVNSTITYEVKKSNTSVADAFISSTPVPLKKGSDALIRAMLSSLWIWRCWKASSRMMTEGSLLAKRFTM